MSKVENAADGSWVNLNSNQAVNLKNTSPFKALKFGASPISLLAFSCKSKFGKKGVNCLDKFCIKKKKRIWRSGVKASLVALFPKTRNFTPLCLSLPRCVEGYRRHTAGKFPCDGLAYPPAGAILLGMFHVKETGISSCRLDLWLYVRLNLYPYLHIV